MLAEHDRQGKTLSRPQQSHSLFTMLDIFAHEQPPGIIGPSDRCIRGKLSLLTRSGWGRLTPHGLDHDRPAQPRGQVPKESQKKWSQTGSNRRPHACKARALPTELWPQGVSADDRASRVVVGLGRLERPTSPLSGVRSNHLSYRPRAIEARRPAKPKRSADRAIW